MASNQVHRKRQTGVMLFTLIGFGAVAGYASLKTPSAALLERNLKTPPRFEPDLETATVGELQLLPGIGEKRAAEIVSKRQ